MPDLIPTARPVPSTEDRMTETPPRLVPTFYTWLDRTEHAQLDARAAAAEQERDDARDERDEIAAKHADAHRLAAFRKGVIDRHRQELGAAGEVLAVVRDAAERIDRALAAYDTTPGETATVNLGQHRRLRREAPNGCDHCSVEPGESHRYPGCPGATPPSSVPPRRMQEEPTDAELAEEIDRAEDAAEVEHKTRFALAAAYTALNADEKMCRYHGTGFERAGMERGEPRCDSCKQPWRVNRALAAIEAAEARL